MPNTNTVDRIMGVGSTTAAQGTKAAGPITLLTTAIQLVTDKTGNTAVVYLQPTAMPLANGPVDTISFRVRATFKTTTGGSSTSVVSIYLGSTVVSGNILATITSQSLSTASAAGFLEFNGIWDSTSTVISGIQRGVYGTTAVSDTITTNTGLTATTISALKFCIAASNGSSVVGTTFQLGEFCVEQV